MMNFYDCRKKVAKWEADLLWLKKDWSENSGVHVELFGFEVGAKGLPAEHVRHLHCRLAQEVIKVYWTVCLQSYYSVPSTNVTIFFWEILGYLAGNMWLNDSTVNYGLQAMIGCRPDVRVLPSHVLRKDGFPRRTQTQRLSDMTTVILPVNHNNVHWSLIMVTVNYSNVRMLGVHFYDPLQGRPYKADIEKIWKNSFWPFIHRWHMETVGGHDPIVDTHWINKPKQPDGACCGVMITAVAYSYVQGLRQFDLEKVSKETVEVMRLRILWTILCNSGANSIDEEETAKAARTFANFAHVATQKESED